MVIQCLHYNYNNTEPTCNDSYDKCARQVSCPELHHQCFVFWKTVPNDTIISAGCFTSEPNGDCAKECIGQHKGSNYYCCCTENLCNAHYKLPPSPSAQPTIPETGKIKSDGSSHYGLWVALFLTTTLIVTYIYKRSKITSKQRPQSRRGENGDQRELNELRNHRENSSISILMPYQKVIDHLNGNHQQNNRIIPRNYLTNHHDTNNFKQTQNNQQFISNNDNNGIDLSSIEFIEEIDCGRFGVVHRATLNESDVAVKIISANDYQTWLNEREIYSTPKIKHPNILNLLYSDEHLETGSYWLILDYAPRGSLYSFLKENIITWREFLLISIGIVHGLSHLHEADIAHRDFKSKNILLKHDMAPCITDFGVAADYTANGSQLDHRRKYLQVGTPRYMAPEVLECSVTFTKASFTKIDVYALSLVLWELLSRCDPLPLPPGSQSTPVLPYKLPFEEYVGSHPDIEKMRNIAVIEKLRPSLKAEWRIYPVSEVCRAIEDGWEYDYDARISASCFVERVESLPS